MTTIQVYAATNVEEESRKVNKNLIQERYKPKTKLEEKNGILGLLI